MTLSHRLSHQRFARFLQSMNRIEVLSIHDGFTDEHVLAFTTDDGNTNDIIIELRRTFASYTCTYAHTNTLTLTHSYSLLHTHSLLSHMRESGDSAQIFYSLCELASMKGDEMRLRRWLHTLDLSFNKRLTPKVCFLCASV